MTPDFWVGLGFGVLVTLLLSIVSGMVMVRFFGMTEPDHDDHCPNCRMLRTRDDDVPTMD